MSSSAILKSSEKTIPEIMSIVYNEIKPSLVRRVFYSNKQRGLDVISKYDICVSMTVHRMLFPIKRRWNVISQHKIFCSQGNSHNDCPKQSDFQPPISIQLGLSSYNNFQPNNDCKKWQIPAPRMTMTWCYLRLSIGKYVCSFRGVGSFL